MLGSLIKLRLKKLFVLLDVYQSPLGGCVTCHLALVLLQTPVSWRLIRCRSTRRDYAHRSGEEEARCTVPSTRYRAEYSLIQYTLYCIVQTYRHSVSTFQSMVTYRSHEITFTPVKMVLLVRYIISKFGRWFDRDEMKGNVLYIVIESVLKKSNAGVQQTPSANK